MPEWLRPLLPYIVGSLLTGGFLLLSDNLKHRRTRKERYQEVVIEKRLTACNDLMRMLIEFSAALSPLTNGVEPLRLPKNPRISPNPTEEDIRRARNVNQQLVTLSHFVATNELLLNSDIVKVWHRYFAALSAIQAKVTLGIDNDILLADALEHLMFEFIDEIGGGIQKTLREADVEFVSSQEWRGIQGAGIQLAKKFMVEAKARLEPKR